VTALRATPSRREIHKIFPGMGLGHESEGEG